jgi:chromosome segregation ATPase
MAQPPDHEPRITPLEAQVTDLDERVRRSEHEAAAARVLASGADRAVADLRLEVLDFREHNNRLHNATRQDIRELREDLTDLRQEVTDLRQGHTDLRSQVESGFMEMRAKFDATAVGLQQIVGMLTTLIEHDDQ